MKVGDVGSKLSKMVKFKKVGGKPATYGAHRHLTIICLMALIMKTKFP